MRKFLTILLTAIMVFTSTSDFIVFANEVIINPNQEQDSSNQPSDNITNEDFIDETTNSEDAMVDDSGGVETPNLLSEQPVTPATVYYTVSFYDWDNTPLGPAQTIAENESAIAPNEPHREGYKFVGWSQDFSSVTQDMSIYATYELLINYTVTINYIYFDYTIAHQPQVYSLVAGESMSQTFTAPDIQGFIVDQSAIDVNISNIDQDYIYTFMYSPANNTPYSIAHYQQNVTLTNPVNPMDPVNFTLVETNNYTGITAQNVTATGKSYTGFTTPVNLPSSQIASDGSTVLKVFYIRNEYVVTYDSAQGSFVAPVAYRYGAPVTTPPNPVRAGYTFTGWNSTIPTTMPANDLTFVATWTPSGTVPYTVVYWLENTTGTGYDYVATHASSGVAGTTPVIPATIPSNVVFPIASTYYTYNSAYTNANKPTSIDGDGTTIVNVYYTRNTYTINFNFNAAKYKLVVNGTTYTNSPYTITAKYGANIESKWPGAPTLVSGTSDGNFTGWLGGGIYYVTKQFYLDSSIINNSPYNASWNKNTNNVTVYYYFQNVNGSGYTANHSQTVAVNPNSTYWNAKSFVGFTPQTTTSPITNGTATFYYTRNQYNVTFYNDNQVEKNESGIYYEADIQALGQNFVPSRPSSIPDDYIFSGWYTTKDGIPGTEFNFQGAKMPAYNLILYAKWEMPSFTVTFNPDNGDNNTIQNVIDGGLATQIQDPVKPGFIFGGWYLPGSDVKYVFTFPVTENIVLTARWIPITATTYDVVYIKDGLEFSRHTVTGKTVDETVVEYAITIPGYLPDAKAKNLTLTLTGNVITFVYTPIVETEYTIKYVDLNGNSLIPDKILTTLQTSVTANYVNIPGYYPNYYQQTLVISNDSAANIITFVYTPTAPVNYTVKTYLENLDGGYSMTQVVKTAPAGSVATEIPVSLTGYLFAPENSVTSRVVATNGSTVLSLYYVRTKHTINFTSEGDGSLLGVSTYSGIKNESLFGNSVIVPIPVAQPGYKFDGWSPALPDSTTPVLGDATYVAHFSKDDSKWATISFDGNGSTSGSMPNSGELLIGTQYTLPTNQFSRVHHSFVNWDTMIDGTGESLIDGQTITVTQNMTLYAQWNEDARYTVSYLNNGATGSVYDLNAYYAQEIVSVKSASTLSYPGYRFIGWQTPENTMLYENETFVIQKNTQLLAIWEYDAEQWQTFKYDKNAANATGAMTDDTVIRNSDYLVKNNEFALQNYTFVGWNSKPDGSGVQYNSSQIINIDQSGTYTLYAIWQENEKYTVNYHANNSTADTISDTQDYAGTTKIVFNDSTFTYDNHFFLNWNTMPDASGQTYQPGDEILLNGNINLYAQWKESKLYITTYLDGFGSGSFTEQNYADFDDTFDLTVAQMPFTRPGYTFRYWLSDSNQVAFPGDVIKDVNRNVTYTAQWDIDNFSINYILDGGIVSLANPVSYNIETPTFVLNNPIKPGYTFVGWTLDNEDISQAQIYREVQQGTTGNLEFTAHWVIDESQWATVTFDGNTADSGMMPPSEKMLIGTEYTLPENQYKKSNWTYLNWDTSQDGTGDSYLDQSNIVVTGNITLYAQWSINDQYNVSYINNGAQGSLFDNNLYFDSEVVTVLSPDTLVYPGYMFTGYIDQDGNSYSPNDTFVIHKNMLLIAQWVYDDAQWTTIHYDKNSVEAQGVMDDDTIIRNSNYYVRYNQFSLSNYTFIGWNTSFDGTGTHYSENDLINVDLSGIYTLYAQWQENDKFTINYHSNDNTGTILSDIPNYAGTLKYVYSDTTFTFDHHFFLNWNTAPDGSGTTYFAHQLVTLNQNLDLYAQWKPSILYTMTYNDGFATAQFTQQQYANFQDVIDVVIAQNPFSRSGYNFRNWLSSNNQYFMPSDIINGVHQDMTFTANWDLINYAITYDLQGGTLLQSNPSQYNVETPDFTLNNPHKQGYTFIGWTNDAQIGMEPNINLTITNGTTGDLSFTAHWIYDESQWVGVSFDGNNSTSGTMDPSPKMLKGSTYDLPTNMFLREHYTFIEWNTQVDGTGISYYDMESITVNSDIILYAQWQEDPAYTVTYINNGASGTVSDNNKYYAKDHFMIKDVSTLSYPGYTFTGWLEVGGSSYNPGDDFEISKNTVFVAQWKYDDSQWTTIQYDKNNKNATGEMLPDTILRNSDYQIRGNSFELPNYTFIGWNTKKDATGISYSEYETINLDISGSVTLYAIWQENPKYTINYMANNGTSDLVSEIALYSGSQRIILPDTTFTFENNYFMSWNTQADGSGMTYLPGQSIIQTANLNLYAQWIPSNLYIVTYLDGYSTGELTEQYYSDVSGFYDLVVAQNSFTRFGYEFAEWKFLSGQFAKPGETIEDVSSDLTLQAQWKPINYHINYDLQGGNEVVVNPTTYNIETNDFEIVNPYKKGYTFTGWSYAGQDEQFLQLIVTKGTTGDISLVAHWEIDESQWTTIQYDKNNENATGEMIADTIIRNSDYQIRENSFELSNYTFIGWNTKNDATGISYSEYETINLDISGSVTLYAIWQENPKYTINYMANNGTSDVVSEIPLYSGSQRIILPDTTFTFENNYFMNWNTQADGSGMTYLPGQSIIQTSNIDLYAQWIPSNLYIVTYLDGYSTGEFSEQYYSDVSGFYDLVVAQNSFTRFGYEFVEWKLLSGQFAKPGETIEDVSSDLTLQAQWKPINYHINYDLQGGNEVVVNPTTYNIETNDFEIVNPYKKGYTFTGWSYAGQDEQFLQLIVTKGTTGDISLVAHWEIDESQWSTISFVNTDPTMGELLGTLEYKGIIGDPLSEEFMIPTYKSYEGYEWDKWSITPPNTYPQQDLVIYAYWKTTVIDTPEVPNEKPNGNDNQLLNTSIDTIQLPLAMMVLSIGLLLLVQKNRKKYY